MIEVTHNVSISAPSVTHEFVYDMLVDYYKNMENRMQQMIEERIDKFVRNLDISHDSPAAHVNQHALNSSTIHVPLESTKLNTSINYFSSQSPLARITFIDKEVPKSEIVFSPPIFKSKLQHSSMLSMPNDCFVNIVNSHVDVTTYRDNILVASASNCSNGLNHTYYNSEYEQMSMSITHLESFNGFAT
jgi:galactitol-specific phosphotransferase system IIB component